MVVMLVRAKPPIPRYLDNTYLDDVDDHCYGWAIIGVLSVL